jgi:outer membrane protein assembly factor BamB
LAFLTASLASGQEPKRKLVPQPNPLLPAEQAWLVMLPAPPSAGGAMDAEHVYIPTQAKTIVALSRQTGQVAWTTDVESVVAPVVAAEMLFLAASGSLVALDPKTGERRWLTPFEKTLVAGLAVSAGWIVGVSDAGEVTAFNARDGAAIWQQPLGSPTRHAPVTDGSRVFLSLMDGRVVALSLADGAKLWERALPGTLSVPATATDRVFVGSDTNDFFALSPESGEIEWRWRSGGDVIGADADTEGRVFFASLDNLVRAVNRGNGNQRWRKETSSRPAQPPRVAGDVVVIAGVAPTITSYNAKTGAIVGTYVAPAELQGPPLIDPVLRPFRVAMVLITRDGRVAGVYPAAMLFKEPAIAAWQQLPGVRLGREAAP